MTDKPEHYFETPQARGERIYFERYGLGTIVEMHDGTYGMHNGIKWDSPEVVDQYIGIDGIDPHTLTTELLHFIAVSREQRIRAEAAEKKIESIIPAIESLRATIHSSPKDFYLSPDDAWIYGVLSGWGDAINEVSQNHSWDENNAKRLNEYNAAVMAVIEGGQLDGK